MTKLYSPHNLFFFSAILLLSMLVLVSSGTTAEIIIDEDNYDHQTPVIAYNWKHNEYLIAWSTCDNIGGYYTSSIKTARVNASGQLIGTYYSAFVNRNNAMLSPSITYDPVNDQYLIVWMIYSGTEWDISGRLFYWNDMSYTTDYSSIINICIGNHDEVAAKVAYSRGAEEFLVVWSDAFSGAGIYNISAQRLKASDGTKVGNAVTLMSSRYNADVAYNHARNEYLVVADDLSDIYAVRYTSDLSNSFSGYIHVAGWFPDKETLPSVAACKNSDQYLVTWQSDQSVNNLAIYGRYISGDGSLGEVFQIHDTSDAEERSHVSSNYTGDAYLVTWESEVPSVNGNSIIGKVIKPNDYNQSFFTINNASTSHKSSCASSAGGNKQYLSAWEEYVPSVGATGIHACLTDNSRVNALPQIINLLLMQ